MEYHKPEQEIVVGTQIQRTISAQIGRALKWKQVANYREIWLKLGEVTKEEGEIFQRDLGAK